MRKADRLPVAVAIASAVSCVLAIVALAISIFDQQSQISTAAGNSCRLLRVLVLDAYGPGPRGPAVIAKSPLADCGHYAQDPVHFHPPSPTQRPPSRRP